MNTIVWPKDGSSDEYYGSNVDLAIEYDHINFFKMIRMNENDNTIINQDSLDFIPTSTNPYEKQFYIDLDEDIDQPSAETDNRYAIENPLVSHLKSFTVDILMNVHDPSETGHAITDAEYFDKSRVFFAIGQNVTGVEGHTITVGTDSNKSTDDEKRVPVIGISTKNGVFKSDPESTALGINLSTATKYASREYIFKLVYNPIAVGKEKLALFIKDNEASSPTFELQCYGPIIPNTINNQVTEYQLTKPRLYLFTSGWISENGWEGKYDYAFGTLDRANTDPHPITVKNDIDYPIGFLTQRWQAGIAPGASAFTEEPALEDGYSQKQLDRIYLGASALTKLIFYKSIT